MTHEIPIETLLRRLAETPFDFLKEPKIGPIGEVHVAALVHDVLQGMGLRADAGLLEKFAYVGDPKSRNAQKMVMIVMWLLADPSFADIAPKATAMNALLLSHVPVMAEQGQADKYVHDPERREELARTVLAQLGVLPEGETAAQAEDRLTRISSTERLRLLSASRAAETRAREVREALARKAAQESADKFTRE